MPDRIPPGPESPDIAAVDRLTARRDHTPPCEQECYCQLPSCSICNPGLEDSFYLELQAINEERAATGRDPMTARELANEQRYL